MIYPERSLRGYFGDMVTKKFARPEAIFAWGPCPKVRNIKLRFPLIAHWKLERSAVSCLKFVHTLKSAKRHLLENYLA